MPNRGNKLAGIAAQKDILGWFNQGVTRLNRLCEQRIDFSLRFDVMSHNNTLETCAFLGDTRTFSQFLPGVYSEPGPVEINKSNITTLWFSERQPQSLLIEFRKF
jgi:hypothetical protein